MKKMVVAYITYLVCMLAIYGCYIGWSSMEQKRYEKKRDKERKTREYGTIIIIPKSYYTVEDAY